MQDGDQTDPLEQLRGVEPDEAARRAVNDLARRFYMKLIDAGRTWLTAKLVAALLAAVGGLVLVGVSYGVVGAIICGSVTFFALAYAVFSRRLMYVERSRRRWAEIAVKRERQKALRAQDAIDEATLAVSGVIRPSHPGGARDLLRAVLAVRRQVAVEKSEAGPKARQSEVRQTAAPQRIDERAIIRRREVRKAEVDELEAEIQLLADPSDLKAALRAREARQASKEARQAALNADALARQRRRQGRSATAQPGTERQLEVRIGPEGVQSIETTEIPRTPEQIANQTET